MFQHSPITQPRAIRVIELLPSKSAQPLSIRLKVVSLEDAKFEALSYSWEGQPANLAIQCDEEELRISATCKAALERLRNPKKRIRTLWIDQICINQNSIDEKNQQVALMGEIYRRADKVLVWLGVNPAADKLLEYVNLYEKFGKVPFGQSLHVQYRARLKLEKKLAENVDIHLPSLHPISWFDRMWTIQEVALAQKVDIITAQRSMDYDIFITNLDKWLTERMNQPTGGYAWGHIMMEGDMTTQQLWARRRVRDLIHPIHRQNAVSRDDDRAALLCHLTSSSATVSSDKIFAVHELMKVLGVDLPPPDYRLPASEVYWNACCIFMTSQNSLEALGVVNPSAQFEDVPSWVLDFSRSSPRWEMNSGWLHASGSQSKPLFRLENNNRLLVTKGKIIDVVKGKTAALVGNKVQSLLTDRDLLLANSLPACLQTIDVLQEWVQAALQLRPSRAMHASQIDPITLVVHQSGSLINEVWAMTGIPDMSLQRCNQLLQMVALSITDKTSIYFQAQSLAGNIPRWLRSNPAFAIYSTSTEGQLLLILIALGLYPDLLEAWEKAVGNVFIWTNEGCLGTGPTTVQEDDVVALIPGIRTPLILRASSLEGRYRVVGPAFVHGVMEGQKWDERDVEVQRRGPAYTGSDLPDILIE